MTRRRRNDPVSRRIDAALAEKRKRIEAEYFAGRRQTNPTQDALDRAAANAEAAEALKRDRGKVQRRTVGVKAGGVAAVRAAPDVGGQDGPLRGGIGLPQLSAVPANAGTVAGCEVEVPSSSTLSLRASRSSRYTITTSKRLSLAAYSIRMPSGRSFSGTVPDTDSSMKLSTSLRVNMSM